MEKIMMYCYSGPSWAETPIRGKAVVDVTNMSAEMAAHVADLQQELMGRRVHVKRETDFRATWDDGSEM